MFADNELKEEWLPMGSVALNNLETIDLTLAIVDHFEKYVHLYGDPPGDSSVKHMFTNNLIIRRQVDAFNLYKNYLKDSQKILDWGCKHGIDAYLAKLFLSNADLEIHGCDLYEEKHGILYEHCNLKYSKINHPYQLPYTDNYFSSVISSGVLEHVPNDYESLKEIYRILEPDGYLIITFLPNKSSYTEFFGNFLKPKRGHNRKYSLFQTKQRLLHAGFIPTAWGFHQLMPSLSSLHAVGDTTNLKTLLPIAEGIYSLNRLTEKLWPINILSANIFIVAQKKISI
jgi:2-polyprenyl-3-methyl-5-hydroxy-6-metoxy-1,4-benzoquinol methylase